MSIALLIIDPQMDFCDPQGALSVPGAEADMERLAAMVRRLTPKLEAVHVTLDSHHLLHIAHPIFWQDAAGHPPAPFTLIQASDVDSGIWRATQPAMQERASAYVHALEAKARYVLCIWPPHCLIGSAGHQVVPALFDALTDWERQRLGVVDYVLKGSNLYTEHYSAIQAEVVDPADPGTQVNTALIDALMQVETVIVAGEAGSHCVANTVRDLAEQAGGEVISKLVLLTDAVCPVTGFEALQEDFLRDMTARGMRLSTTTEYLP